VVKKALRKAIEPVTGDAVSVERWETVQDAQGNWPGRCGRAGNPLFSYQNGDPFAFSCPRTGSLPPSQRV
jgi:hypothetical protein